MFLPSLGRELIGIFIWLQYRDIVRQFIKGTDGLSGAFAECLCGSPNLYQVWSFILHYFRSYEFNTLQVMVFV